MVALTPLDRAYKVDEAINSPGKLVVIRFGPEGETDFRNKVDKWLQEEAANSKDVAAYAVATNDVPELVARYKLNANITLIFFLDYVQVARLNLKTDAELENHKGTIGRLVENRKTNGAADTTAGGNQSSSAPPPTRASYRVRRYHRRYGINN